MYIVITFENQKNNAMEMNYLCPHCRAQLKIDNELILTIKSHKTKHNGLLILDPQVGNYSLRYHETIDFEKGEEFDIYCPICFKELKAKKVNPKLLYLIMQNKQGEEFEIYFSRIFGEHSTFVLSHDNIIERKGEDASTYYNYFSARLKQAINS